MEVKLLLFPHVRTVEKSSLAAAEQGDMAPSRPTVVLHQGLHLLLSASVPLGDVHVQRVVTAGPAIGPLPPLSEGAQQAGARLRHHMVHCKSTGSSGRGHGHKHHIS